MRRHFLIAAAICVLIAQSPISPTTAVTPKGAKTPKAPIQSPTLPDFDIRTEALGARQLLVETGPAGPATEKASLRTAALERLEAESPHVRVHWSRLTGGPRTIVPIGGTVTAAAAATPAEIAEGFIRENRDLYGLDESDLSSLRLVREYVTRETGVTHLTYVQEVEGRRVIGADLRMGVDTQGRIVWVGGELVPNAGGLSKRGGWTFDAVRAAEAAAATIGADASARVLASKGGPESETVVELGAAFTEPATCRQMLFPIAAGAVRPAWNVLLYERGPGNVYVVTVDAEKGTLLARHNLTRYLQQGPKTAHFRVFTKDSPQPDLPHVSNNPAHVDREMVTFVPGSTAGSPMGWVFDLATTAGNNVRAQEDRDGNNVGGMLANGDDLFTFDHELDIPIKTNQENTEAAITNLFYWNNFIHDYLFDLGFDEAAGNFQATNFSGQGRGNDPVIADAQDGAGTNNANFSTPPDGFAPRMQMFLWSGGYDGDFDQTIIIHEYVHGLSGRLIGGADYTDGLTGPQSGGMGEGWSDWYALTMLADSDLPLDADYVVGGYSTRDFNAGVRLFPYSTRMTRNPLTYSDIDPATANIFNNPTEVHNVGEVWCSALWEVRANFIAEYGFDVGRALVERLVTDGMKFSINNPSFTEARDGILVADQVRTGGANQCLIWEGFAKRGVGYSAFTLNGSSTAIKEAFDLPPWCESDGQPSFDAASYDEFANAVTLRVGDGDLTGSQTTTVTVSAASGDRETVVLDRAENVPGLFEKALALRRGAAAVEDGRLDVALGDTVTLSYDDASSGGAPATATARVVRRVSLFEDDLEAGSSSWKSKQFQLTTEASASPTHSWTDSPGRNYADQTTYTLKLKPKFDLSNSFGSKLVFSHKLDTEPGYDLCIVEARAKGVKWKTMAVFSGTQAAFAPVTIDFSEFDGKPNVKVRFKLVSDPFVNGDGWHIDDVEMQTGRLN